MVPLGPEARALLESSALVHMVTLNPDGSPQVTIVWAGLDGDEIVSAHLFANRKVRNVQRDPRVSLSIEGTAARRPRTQGVPRRPRPGPDRAGRGAPSSSSASPTSTSSPDVRFPPIDDPPAGYVMRTTPARVGGVGPWAG